MEKLAKVGSVVVNVGNMCRNHGLKVEELPSDLLAIFGSFQRCFFPLLNKSWSNSKSSDLDGIDDALKECADVKGIKMLLLRNDLLKKVKQYDSKLSMILQVYQVCRKYHFPFRPFKLTLQGQLEFFPSLATTHSRNRRWAALIVTRYSDRLSDRKHSNHQRIALRGRLVIWR
jgi:hypothetical protein